MSRDFPGKNTGAGCHFLLQGIFWFRDQTHISCLAGGFFTIWAMRTTQVSTGGWRDEEVLHKFYIYIRFTYACIRTHNGLLFSHKKWGSPTACDSTDESRGHYAKQKESERITRDLAYMLNLYKERGKSFSHRKRDEAWGLQRGRIGEGELQGRGQMTQTSS